MIQKFKAYLDTLNISPSSSIYLAISGGIDSMVLSHLLNKLKIPHTLLHCNFNLRGIDSELDEQFIIDYAKQNNLKYFVKHFDTETLAQQQKLTIQECARNLRYDWFNSFLTDPDSVLFTAHHLDDSIETFFINLLRGTGLKGLKGITHKPKIIRPLLAFSKSEINFFAKTNNIQFREDISNSSDKYLRNNIRHHVIPRLNELDNGLNKKMNTLFSELNQIDSYLDSQILKLKSDLEIANKLLISNIKDLPLFLLTRLFDGYGVTRKNSSELVKIINGKSGSIFISETYKFLKDRDYLIIEEKGESHPLSIEIKLTDDLTVPINSENYLKLTILNSKNDLNYKDNNTVFLNADLLQRPIIIRNWLKGDKIKPFGMNGSKLISDILINKKINLFDKNRTLVLESKNEIVWLVGHTISENFKITANTSTILKCEFLKY